MGYGWEGPRVRLAALDKGKHLKNIVRWLNDPDVTKWTRIGDWPLSLLEEEESFDVMSRTLKVQAMFAVETLENEHIGIAGIHGIDWQDGAAHTNIIIGEQQYRGQGFGSEAVSLRTNYAFEVLGLRMLMTEVMAENLASLIVLEKAGYREVGRVPQRRWKRGAYRDVILLAVNQQTWRRQ